MTRQHEFPRRGGAHTFEQLEAEAVGKNAASSGAPRAANPHAVSSSLSSAWDRGHCEVTGANSSAPNAQKSEETPSDDKFAGKAPRNSTEG